MAQQLMTEEAFQTSGRNVLTLVRDKNLTVVLTVLKAGAVLQKHHAPAPVTLLPLFGHIVLLADVGG
jgi:quercetin dioxygenase-like cupin family protein